MKLLLSVFILSPLLFGNERVTLGIENSWPPYANRHGFGYSREIVKEAFKAVKIDADFKVLPYARVLDHTRKGKIHGGMNVTRQSTTERMFHFSEEPILKAKASFYFPVKSKISKYKSIQTLPEGTKIGLISGYEYGDIYEHHRKKFHETRVKTQDQIINMLVSGRIDCAIMFDEVASYTLKEMKLQNGAITKAFWNHTSDIFVAFNKHHPKSKWFGKKLDEGMRAIKSNGIYTKILRKQSLPPTRK